MGWRTIKTAVSAMLVIVLLTGRDLSLGRIRLFGMRSNAGDPIQNGSKGCLGTLIKDMPPSGVWGIFVLSHRHTFFWLVPKAPSVILT